MYITRFDCDRTYAPIQTDKCNSLDKTLVLKNMIHIELCSKSRSKLINKKLYMSLNEGYVGYFSYYISL